MTDTYRKRVITFEAIVWDGTDATAAAVRTWVEASTDVDAVSALIDTNDVRDSWNDDLGVYMLPNGQVLAAPGDERCLIVVTPQGPVVAHPGWVLVRGLPNQFAALQRDMFDATYERFLVPQVTLT